MGAVVERRHAVVFPVRVALLKVDAPARIQRADRLPEKQNNNNNNNSNKIQFKLPSKESPQLETIESPWREAMGQSEWRDGVPPDGRSQWRWRSCVPTASRVLQDGRVPSRRPIGWIKRTIHAPWTSRGSCWAGSGPVRPSRSWSAPRETPGTGSGRWRSVLNRNPHQQIKPKFQPFSTETWRSLSNRKPSIKRPLKWARARVCVCVDFLKLWQRLIEWNGAGAVGRTNGPTVTDGIFFFARIFVVVLFSGPTLTTSNSVGGWRPPKLLHQNRFGHTHSGGKTAVRRPKQQIDSNTKQQNKRKTPTESKAISSQQVAASKRERERENQYSLVELPYRHGMDFSRFPFVLWWSSETR